MFIPATLELIFNVAAPTPPAMSMENSREVSAIELKKLLELNFSITAVAKHFKISRPTVYKLISKYQLEYTKGGFSNISDDNLDSILREIIQKHPNAGQVMLEVNSDV